MHTSDFFVKNYTAVNKRVLASTSISIGLGYLVYKYMDYPGLGWMRGWRLGWPKSLTWNKKENEPVLTEEDISELYEYRYIDEFQNKEYTEKTDDELHKLLGQYVVEDTPDGKVAMSYDHTCRKFIYYADKNILFKYLETVSRKYAIVHDCDKIYVDIANELYKGKVKLLDEFKKDAEDAANKVNTNSKSVFANFKSYNSKGTNTQGKGKWLLLEHSNNYINKGKLDDYQKILNPLVDTNPSKKITFADYKKKNIVN